MRTRPVDLPRQLQDIRSLLDNVASESSLTPGSRASLSTAMRSIQAIIEDVTSGGGKQSGDPVDRAFQESRAKEAKSEVDSGEFDVHG